MKRGLLRRLSVLLGLVVIELVPSACAPESSPAPTEHKSVEKLRTDPATGASAGASGTALRTGVSSVQVLPASVALAPGMEQRFTANTVYADGRTFPLRNAVWSSSNPTVATVELGVASAHATGTALIGAVDPSTGLSGSATLNVNCPA